MLQQVSAAQLQPQQQLLMEPLIQQQVSMYLQRLLSMLALLPPVPKLTLVQ